LTNITEDQKIISLILMNDGDKVTASKLGSHWNLLRDAGD